MRKFSIWVVLVLVITLLTGFAQAQGDTMKTVTDMAGRTVTLKQDPGAIAATGQPGAVMLIHTLSGASDRMELRD